MYLDNYPGGNIRGKIMKNVVLGGVWKKAWGMAGLTGNCLHKSSAVSGRTLT